jgi:selenocysteine-specific elongation factor
MPGARVRRRVRARLHLATRELLCEVRLGELATERTVRDAAAEIRVVEPVVAAFGQRFVIRDEGGARTLGGGAILDPSPTTRAARGTLPPPPTPDTSAEQRVEQSLCRAGLTLVPPALLSTRAGAADAAQAEQLCRKLAQAGRARRIELHGASHYVHASALQALTDEVKQRLERHLAEHPRSPGVPRGEWPSWMPRACDDALRAALAELLIDTGAVEADERCVRPRGQGELLSRDDRALFDAILHEFAAGAFQPPGETELRCRTPRNARRVAELVRYAAARGRLVRVADGIWLHAERHAEMIGLVGSAIRERGGLSVADIRTLLNSSRKFVVPICEHLDAIGQTRREGDLRRLGPKAAL